MTDVVVAAMVGVGIGLGLFMAVQLTIWCIWWVKK